MIRTYNIYTRTGDSHTDIALIPEGFSFWAAIFQGFWALYHRMWLPGIALITLNITLTTLEKSGIISFPLLASINTAIVLLIGFEGQNLRMKWLEQQGYQLTDIIMNNTPIQAQLAFLEKNKASKKFQHLKLSLNSTI